MKAAYSFVFAIFLLSLVSCNEDEEPRSPLIGTWENRNYLESSDSWYVDSYKFKNDSLFDITSTVRKTENGEELGYRMTATSWYNLEGSTFKYYYSDALIYFGGGENNPNYGTKDKMAPGIVDFFRIPEGELTFSSDLSQFTFQEDCWRPNPDNDCFEFPLQTFIRVD